MIVFHLFFIKLLIGTVLHLTAPRTLFPEACSTLLYSSDGQLLGARIAPDGQWRFPPADSLPGKFVTCLLTYEDKRFFRHSGVDPVAIVRAMRINLSRGKVVSGGSTITMQLARIARGNRDRTLYEKMVETGYALLLETAFDKHQILNFYAVPGYVRDGSGRASWAGRRVWRSRPTRGRRRFARNSARPPSRCLSHSLRTERARHG